MGFQDLKKGDRAYTIVRGRGAPYAVVERVQTAHGDYITTLPCYSDGEPMLYFSAMWHRRSGRRIPTGREGKGYAKRLVLKPPAGMRVAQNPATPRERGAAVTLDA